MRGGRSMAIDAIYKCSWFTLHIHVWGCFVPPHIHKEIKMHTHSFRVIRTCPQDSSLAGPACVLQ